MSNERLLRDSNEICYLHSTWASAAAVWTCGSFSWRWSCSPDSLIEGVSWVEEANGDHVSRGCSRLIGISRRWGWDRHLPAGSPVGGPWSTSGKWMQWSTALANAPIPDLTWPDPFVTLIMLITTCQFCIKLVRRTRSLRPSISIHLCILLDQLESFVGNEM